MAKNSQKVATENAKENTLTGEQFKEFVSDLTADITKILNYKLVNDVDKFPESNGECWVQLADTITNKHPNIEVWGCYTPENDGVTVEVRDTAKNTTKTIQVNENGSCLIDRLCMLIGSIGSLIGLNFETIDKYLFCLIVTCLDGNENGLTDRCLKIIETVGLKGFHNLWINNYYKPDLTNLGCKIVVGYENGVIWSFNDSETQTIGKAMNILLVNVDY